MAEALESVMPFGAAGITRKAWSPAGPVPIEAFPLQAMIPKESLPQQGPVLLLLTFQQCSLSWVVAGPGLTSESWELIPPCSSSLSLKQNVDITFSLSAWSRDLAVSAVWIGKISTDDSQ